MEIIIITLNLREELYSKTISLSKTSGLKTNLNVFVVNGMACQTIVTRTSSYNTFLRNSFVLIISRPVIFTQLISQKSKRQNRYGSLARPSTRRDIGSFYMHIGIIYSKWCYNLLIDQSTYLFKTAFLTFSVLTAQSNPKMERYSQTSHPIRGIIIKGIIIALIILCP